ncbi:MAG: hypothetical protein ACOCRK_02480 [bacterium]
MKIPKIGRGKNMSIAKAALIVFYEFEFAGPYIYTGNLVSIHLIIDIAGAKHCSFITARQVVACLNNSPYWNVEGQVNVLRGIANCYIPSKEGKQYYNKYLYSMKEYDEIIAEVEAKESSI